MRLTVLGSGSSGNCSVVSTGDTTVMVDAGLSAKQLVLRLEAAGHTPDSLDAILLTHEHGDHTGGLGVFTKKWPVPVYTTTLTKEAIQDDYDHKIQWRLMATGSPFMIKDLRIECFTVPHDATDPVGFLFQDGVSKLGLVSDVGHITNLIKDRLKGSHTVFIEANYDIKMLDEDTKRPWSTKQRISASHGHLSNQQAADLISAIAHDGLHQVVLGHLSEDCNDPETACRYIREAVPHLTELQVWCADRKTASPTREVSRLFC